MLYRTYPNNNLQRVARINVQLSRHDDEIVALATLRRSNEESWQLDRNPKGIQPILFITALLVGNVVITIISSSRLVLK